MRFAILINEPPEGFAARRDPALREDYMAGTYGFLQHLKDAGVFVGGAGLEPPGQTLRLHFEHGQAVVQDGPFADTKEQLGGFFLIEVADIDAAKIWASRFPQRPGIVIEVRPAIMGD